MNHANYSEIAFEFGNWMHRKITPFIGAGDKERNSSGLPIPRIFLRNKLTLNCHNRRSIKFFSIFHWRMVALGYHVHCDQNKRLFITLDLRYRVTVAEWPLWCFPLPTDTQTHSFHGPLVRTGYLCACPRYIINWKKCFAKCSQRHH